ncbi:MAG: beta strand repeat-containing protein [Akkermansia muciniphila]
MGDTTKIFNDLVIGSTLPTTTKEALWVYTSTGAKVTVTSGTQGQLNNAGTIILGNGSYTTTTTGEDGNPSTSAPREVTASQLFLQGWNGNGGSTKKIDITSALIVGVNGGDLSSDGAKNAAVRFGADTNASYEVKISGDITVAADATFVAGGNNAVISGSIKGNGKTLTLGDFNSAAIYNLTGADEKSISLGGLTISGNTAVNLNYGNASIGTLTLNSSSTSSALTLTGSGTTTITSLVTGGNVLDASEMTGTLTIGGAKWTGNLTVASVEVLKAKDAGTATILANSMNTTRGISYSFSATDTSVYRVRRTESLTGLTAKLQGDSGSRIVVDATCDGTTFTNVGLNELLAGDKVTINGLTGWIGDNSSNSISANLVFEGANSINNGSSDGTINYSGAISGNGTLSFDWIVTESNGTSTIKTNTYVFTGDLSGFTGTIKDEATLNVTIGGSPTNGTVNATIDIAGNLTVSRETTFMNGFTANQLKGNQKIVFDGAQTINCTQDGDFSGNIDVKSGKLTVKGLVKTRGDFDLCGPSENNRYTGTVEVASQGRLTLAGNHVWGLANSAKILLQENGSLKWSDLLITGKAAIADVETGLTIGKTEALSTTQSLNTLRNSTVAYTGTGSKTLSWTLDGCGVSVSTGTLTVNGTNTDTALNVSGGSALFDNSTSTSLVDSTVSGGIVKLKGYYTTLNGTLNISGGTVTNTASGTQGGVEAPLKLGQNGKVVISGGSLENDGFTYTKTDTESAAGTNDASLALTNNAASGSLKVFNGDLKITNATMTKTATDSRGIGIALDNVTLVLGQNTGITTLQKDGETGKTQKLSGVAVASGATLKVENTNATLGVVSGTGTVSTSVNNKFSLALKADGTGSTFSGTLEATAGTLTVTGVGELAMGEYSMPHVMTALKAAGGNVDLMNTPLVSITEMVIGENATVGVYGGTTASEENEGGVYVHGVDASTKGELTVESGATLKSDLQLVNTVLTFNGSLTMGSDLTLYSGNELAGSLYTSWDKKSALTLFTGVDNLTIGTEVAVADKEYKASEVFSNIGNDYSLKMTGSTGNYIVQLVQNTPAPEPTTATLSLLALMGLAARRRRRKA